MRNKRETEGYASRVRKLEKECRERARKASVKIERALRDERETEG